MKIYCMKKMFLLIATLAITMNAHAQRPDIPPQKVSAWDRIWFGMGYTPKFRLADHLPMSAVCNDRSTVHNYAFEVGYMLLPRLSLGLGVGYERYWLRTGGASDNLPLYVHGSWFLSRQPACGWFAYARAGSLLPLDSTLENGVTGGAGIGYRLKPCRRFGIDFKAGYDCSAARVQPIHWAGATSESDNWPRHSLSLGIGLLF